MSVPQFFIGILMCFTLGLTFRFFVPGEFVSYTQSWPRFLYYMMFPRPGHCHPAHCHDRENAAGLYPQ